MKTQIQLVAAALAFVGLATASTVKADAVTDWNEIMQTTVSAGNANIQARSAAITQLAVYEAVNSILGEYEPYLDAIDAPDWASPDAAAVAAAHTVLVVLCRRGLEDGGPEWEPLRRRIRDMLQAAGALVDAG